MPESKPKLIPTTPPPPEPKLEGEWLSITDVARQCGFTGQYVRTLIRKGKLESELHPIREGSMVQKHFVSKESLQEFLAETTRKTKRTDGRNKYVFYAKPREYDKVLQALLKDGLVDVVESIRENNKVKPFYKAAEDE